MKFPLLFRQLSCMMFPLHYCTILIIHFLSLEDFICKKTLLLVAKIANELKKPQRILKKKLINATTKTSSEITKQEQ